MIRPLIPHFDDSLRTVAKPVEDFDVWLRQLANDMAETMYTHGGIGLAAPQVGVLVRLIIVDLSDGLALTCIANPVIVETRGEVVKTPEGCLSFPKHDRRLVPRWFGVTVTGQDLEGEPVRVEADGFLAIALQHEIDHLDGVLMDKRAKREIPAVNRKT